MHVLIFESLRHLASLMGHKARKRGKKMPKMSMFINLLKSVSQSWKTHEK